MNPCRPAVAKDATTPQRALRFGCARRLLPFLSLPMRAWRNLPRSNRRYTGPAAKPNTTEASSTKPPAAKPSNAAIEVIRAAKIPPTKTPIATCLSTVEFPSGRDEDRGANATPIGCANYAVDSAARERWFLVPANCERSIPKPKKLALRSVANASCSLIEPSQLDVSSLSVLASVWREGSDNDSSYLAQLGDLPTESIKREKSPTGDWRTFRCLDCAAVAAPDQSVAGLARARIAGLPRVPSDWYGQVFASMATWMDSVAVVG
jgi:hypothetical protein